MAQRRGTPAQPLEWKASLQRGSRQLVHRVMSRTVRFRGSHLLEMGLEHFFLGVPFI